MPLKKCSVNGKSGWKWGDQGHCYTGPGGKKKAIKQGVAVEGPKKFAAMAKDFIDEATPDELMDVMLELHYSPIEIAFAVGMLVGQQGK